MARTYRRDARGRFASGGGSGKGGSGKAKPATGRAKPKPSAKPVPAKGKASTKPIPSKAKASSKPGLPPPIPQKLLKAANAARAGAAARRKASEPANKIVGSPRRHNAAEAAYWQIKTGKGRSKFNSDKKVREEMQRRGFLKGSKDPQGDLIRIASSARRKKGSKN
jgi:hypothetical protein